MAEFNVPQIDQLNPQQPDYVAKLDEGFAQLREASGVLHQAYEGIASRGGKDIVDFLREKGITVSQHEVLYDKEEREGDTLTRKRAEAIGIVATSRDESRRIEDLIDTYHETRDREAKDLRVKLKVLARAFEDYVDATLQLTEVQALNEINPEYPTAHFFVVRTDGVYEAHIDLAERKVAGVYRKSSLDPKLFGDKSDVTEFRKQSEGVKANAYLVRNPSSELPVSLLVDYAVLTTCYQLLKDRQQKEEEQESGKTLGHKLVDRIKSAMKLFSE